MKITAQLIPHSEFHEGTWLFSVKRPSWYYFKKKQNNNTINNKDFIESVDEPLKELVLFLHKEGIKTTPSCSGHNINDKDFEKIFKDLEKDRDEIKNSGLTMKDVESGKVYVYHDKDYNLPWSKTDFVKKISNYQHKGILGLRLGNRKKAKEEILLLNLDGVRIEEKDKLVLIYTNEKNESDIKDTWKQITKNIKRILE